MMERADQAVQQTIVDAALAGERIVSIVRIAFCTAVGARAAYYWGTTPLAGGNESARAWITFPALAAAIAFSLVAIVRAGHKRPALLLHASVTVDALVCFVVLLPNVLWPADGYRGMPFMIDTATLLLVACASGLRHSVSAACLGGALAGVAYTVLAVVDAAVSDVTGLVVGGAHAMYAILLAGAAALAVLVARGTRGLVARAAHTAIAAERASAGLRSLLREHHDLRTVISSAQLNADLIDREQPGDIVTHLREDLGELRRKLDEVKDRTLVELAGLDAVEPAHVAEAVDHVIAALQARFASVAFDAVLAPVPPVLVAGGPTSLRRMLSNVLVNACEGNGVRGASTVAITVRCEDATVVIDIRDDGPGIAAHVLSTVPAGVSTKPAGLGLGIGVVDGVVRASGGTVEWRNVDGGACVAIALRASL